MTLKWKFIVNPKSGLGECINRWQVAEPMIKEYTTDYSVEYTTEPFQGENFAKEAVNEGFDRIIVVSGDGVVNEVINGLMSVSEDKRKHVAFGVLPFGTGNDYNTVLGLPWNPKNAVRTLFEKTEVSPASVGKFTVEDTGFSKYFNNVLDTGISSLVGHAANQGEGSFIKGPRKYTYLAVKKLFTVKQKKAKITLDDNEPIDIKLMMVTIGTGKANGGGMLCCVDAHPQADDFNVFITQKVTKLQTLIAIKRITHGKHKTMKGTIFTRAKKVKLEVEEPIPFQFDGEVYIPDSIGKTLTTKIIPHAINILYNKEHKSMYWLSKDEALQGKYPKIAEDREMDHGDARKWQEKN